MLPVSTDWGFAGAGVVMFLAAVLMLALIVLPYTTETRRGRARPASGLPGPAGWWPSVGLAVAIIELVGGDAQYSLTPLDAPGLWLAIVAMAITTWGVLELFAEKPAAP